MILGFKKTFPWGEPTLFKEKILANYFKKPDGLHPKIHTIREGNRWKTGMSIQMAYGVRTKQYEQFNKAVPDLEHVFSVQDFELYVNGDIKLFIIDGKEVAGVDQDSSFEEEWILDFVKNDGFDSIEQFFKWFQQPIEGQIIHFTNKKY